MDTGSWSVTGPPCLGFYPATWCGWVYGDSSRQSCQAIWRVFWTYRVVNATAFPKSTPHSGRGGIFLEWKASHWVHCFDIRLKTNTVALYKWDPIREHWKIFQYFEHHRLEHPVIWPSYHKNWFNTEMWPFFCMNFFLWVSLGTTFFLPISFARYFLFGFFFTPAPPIIFLMVLPLYRAKI